MLKRGRKSAAELGVKSSVLAQSALVPPRGLGKAARRVFEATVKACGHLKPVDEPLLGTYASVVVLTQQAARRAKSGEAASLRDFERLARLEASLAGRLRLTARSRVEPRSAARQLRSVGPFPWTVEQPDDEKT